MAFVIFIIFALLIGIGGYFSHLAAKKRREGLQALGQSLGLTYDPNKEYSYDERYPFILSLIHI